MIAIKQRDGSVAQRVLLYECHAIQFTVHEWLRDITWVTLQAKGLPQNGPSALSA